MAGFNHNSLEWGEVRRSCKAEIDSSITRLIRRETSERDAAYERGQIAALQRLIEQFEPTGN